MFQEQNGGGEGDSSGHESNKGMEIREEEHMPRCKGMSGMIAVAGETRQTN
jgi:hypothetical protein